MENNYLDIIIFALIAGFVIHKLYRNFGEIDETEAREKESQARQAMNLRSYLQERALNEEANVAEPEKSSHPNPEVANALNEMSEIDHSFNEKGFLESANIVFDMIIAAFSKNDKKSLKSLLSPELNANFANMLENAARSGMQTHSTLISINSSEITDATISGKKAKIIVEFHSTQIRITKDMNEQLISGNPSKELQIKDIWTFERDFAKSGPDWVLSHIAS